MLCDNCKKRDATIHITRILNNQKKEFHLCNICAKENGPAEEYNEFDIFGNDFFKKLVYPNFSEDSFFEEPKCKTCGMTYSDFNRIGKFGCPDCYTAFYDEVVPLLRRIHGNAQHEGKVPTRGNGVFRTKHQIKRLRQQLANLVNEEKYEDAAKIRDEIHALEKYIQVGTGGDEK